LTTTDPRALWRRLLEEVRHLLEQWSPGALKARASLLAQPPSLPWGIWSGSIEELEAFDDRELAVKSTIEFIGQALVAVFHYLLVVHTPEVWAVEQQRVATWLEEIIGSGSGKPRRSANYLLSHTLTTPRRGWLSCQPTVAWILTPLARHHDCGQVKLGDESGDTWDLFHAIKLYFRHGNPDAYDPQRHGFDVLLRPGGEWERLPLPKKVRRGLNLRPHERAAEGLSVPFMDKRLYVPESLSSPSAVRAAVQDMYALLCIYLVQEEFVSLEEGGDVQAFLDGYLRQFKGAMQVGIPYALAELLGNYQIPEDYRAVRKYVAKTIKGLRANQRRREGWGAPHSRDVVPVEDLGQPDCPDAGSPRALMIPEAAAVLGISERSLYDYRKRGKLRAEEVVIGNGRFLTIPLDEIARLKASFEPKRLRQALIDERAARAGSHKASARRWVERQESLGLGLEVIARRVREMPTPGEEIDETEG
jgi:hypothetical protein